MEATAQAYSVSSIPEPFRILGLRLKPFSLGHYLLLQRFGCRFLEPGQPITPELREDLLLGVLICSMGHREFLQYIEQKDFLKQLRKWGKKVGVFDFPSKSTLFEQYLKASLTEPEYIEMEPGDSSGDWAQNLKMCLMTRLNHSEDEALDMPLSQALADYYKLAESQGTIRLLTPEDMEQARMNEAAFEQLAKMKGANGAQA